MPSRRRWSLLVSAVLTVACSKDHPLDERRALAASVVLRADDGHGLGQETGPRHRLDADEVALHIGAPKDVKWIKAAQLFLDSIESCVDGRDRHAVIGTPGGDVGELLLVIASVESWTGHTLSLTDIELLFDAHLDAFGDFYMHTDEAAVWHVGELLQDDPRFEDDALDTLDEIETLIRSPPDALRTAVRTALLEPDSIGCGHLRSIANDPQTYRVRPEVFTGVMTAFFERLWANNPHLRYPVLSGPHREGAIVAVMHEGPVHPYTRIPMVEPDHHGTELFVVHPSLEAWMRRQRVEFLLETDPWLRSHNIEVEGFVTAVQDLADVHFYATTHVLAPDLPIYQAWIEPDRIEVR